MALILIGLGLIALIVIVAVFAMRHDDDPKDDR